MIAASTPQRSRADSTYAQWQTRGSAVSTSAGEVELVAGLEWRRDAFENNGLSTVGQQSVYAAFGELQIPIIADNSSSMSARKLDLSVSVRRDHYDNIGAITTPQIGLVWRPTKALKLRGSYSDIARVPTLSERYAPAFRIPFTYPDPQRHEVASFMLNLGGNPSLTPTRGRTWSIGWDVLGTIYASLVTWHTVIEQDISPLSLSGVLAAETNFHDRVVRMASTPADIAAGVPGALLSVDLRSGNGGRTSASGVDAMIGTHMRVGEGNLSPQLSATWTIDNSRQIGPGIPSQQPAGYASEYGSIPHVQAIASAEWTRHVVSAFVAARFTSSYGDAVGGSPTGTTIPSQITLDAQAALATDKLLSSQWLRSSTVTVGVLNIGDSSPHFARVGSSIGYDPTQGDPRGRAYYVRFNASF